MTGFADPSPDEDHIKSGRFRRDLWCPSTFSKWLAESLLIVIRLRPERFSLQLEGTVCAAMRQFPLGSSHGSLEPLFSTHDVQSSSAQPMLRRWTLCGIVARSPDGARRLAHLRCSHLQSSRVSCQDKQCSVGRMFNGWSSAYAASGGGVVCGGPAVGGRCGRKNVGETVQSLGMKLQQAMPVWSLGW